jgi:tetratricopeptide (TPR) repeat protein
MADLNQTSRPKSGEPSYTDLTYEVLRSAQQPLTFQEIFDAVNQRRPVTTRNPKGAIRNAFTQGRQLISLGNGRYGYLPYLVQGSLLRVPLTEKKPANQPLVFPDEVRHALWPSFFETGKRAESRPVRLRLPNGDEVTLSLDLLRVGGVWGSPMPEGLHRLLVERRAAAGDSLLIRVVDAVADRCEGWFEPQRQRDAAAVARRNPEVADAAYALLAKSWTGPVPDRDLAVGLLARGLYRSDVAPDTLEAVLRADSRFAYAGLHMWMRAEALTPGEQAEIRERERLEAELAAPEASRLAGFEGAVSPMDQRRAMERIMSKLGALLSQQGLGSAEEANALLQGVLTVGDVPRRRPATPLEQAQDVMYDAWETPSTRERVRLARKAIELSPDCADACVLLAEETARGPNEAADLYAKGVAAGERALGKHVFEQDAGHFWGIVETRPYMRARLGLAHALWAMGKPQEAVAHAWEMLRLNPGDNQGVRYVLLTWLLELGDDTQVPQLLERYPDDMDRGT